MRIRLAGVLLACCALAAESGDSRTAVGLAAIRQADLKADVAFLASDALEGRLSLQRGSEVSIQWIASEYAKAGLQPVTGDSYLQKVPLIEYRTDRQETRLLVKRNSKAETFQFPEAYGGFPDDVTLDAPVVFAGYGITAPELNYDDYAGLDAKGKIVLVFDHEPQENDPQSIFNGLGNTRYATSHVKLVNAQKHGAVALLIVGEPNRKHPSNQERIARIPGSQARNMRMPLQAIENGEIHIPLMNVSDKIASSLLAATGKTPGALQSAIDSNLRPASAPLMETSAELHMANTERRRAASYNVLGLIEGSTPALRNETVVFSGHYDHDGVSAGEVFHGADDNASGTAGVVELARAFAKNPVKPRRSLLFAVFAAEERGLLGSYYYAEHPLRPLATTRAVINFDMIGRNETPSDQTKGLIEIAPDTSNQLNLVGMKYSPDYRATVQQANRAIGLDLSYKWDEEAALNVYFRSDQFPFVLHDVPAMWWFTGFHPDYHQSTDSADRINYVKMQKILQLAYLTGWSFADENGHPRFLANPSAAGH